jgi:flagellar biosynthesis protein FlhG
MMNTSSVREHVTRTRRGAAQPVRVIAVTSGKGGVGKTNVAANLSVALAANGRDVMLLDANLGLGDVDVLLGLQPEFNLSHVLAGDRSLEEVIVEGPLGVKIVPAASGMRRMAELRPMEYAGIVRAFSELTTRLDVLVVDTGAGISDGVTAFLRASQDVVVVVCDEPASIADAHALIRVLAADYDVARFRVLANMVRSVREGYEVFAKLARGCDKSCNVSLDFIGSIPHDEQLRFAVQKQRAVVETYPSSRAALAFKKLAQRVEEWPVPDEADGRLGFFVERLIRARSGITARVA